MEHKYTFINAVNSTKLYRELQESFVADRLQHLNVDGEEVTVYTTESLSSQEESNLEDIIMAHITTDVYAQIETAIKKASEFGQKLIMDFAVENVMMGISQAGKTKEVLAFLTPVKIAVDTGSLYAALEELNTLQATTLPAELSPFVTEARLQAMIDKIEKYLGV